MSSFDHAHSDICDSEVEREPALSAEEMEDFAKDLRDEVDGVDDPEWNVFMAAYHKKSSREETVPVFGFPADLDVWAISHLYPWRYTVEGPGEEVLLGLVVEKYLSDALAALERERHELGLNNPEFIAVELQGIRAMRRAVSTVLEQVVGPAPLTHEQMLRFMTAIAQAMRKTIEQVALAESHQRAAIRAKHPNHVFGTKTPTCPDEPLSVYLAERHPTHTLARLTAIDGPLASDPTDSQTSERRRQLFCLYAFSRCTINELCRYLGCDDRESQNNLKTDLQRAEACVLAAADVVSPLSAGK